MITKGQQQEIIIELNTKIAKERRISDLRERLLTELEAQIENYKEYILILKEQAA